ncbi:MAG: type II methionyl aminopeptidase [Candidatus Bathyarchaeota archaeon]
MLTEDEVEKLRKAGEIASKVRGWVESFVKEGMKIIDICEAVESKILSLGGKPAFPCNVGVNEVAAHYTSPPSNLKVIPTASVVKVDIGVHIDGYIADTATTICFNAEYLSLREATIHALEEALKIVNEGVRVSSVGKVIEETIKRYGVQPIRNLTGHEMSRYAVHAGTQIPNVCLMSSNKMEEGKIYAIEPFSTTMEGYGEVENGPNGYIYRILKDKPPKEEEEKILFNILRKRFHSLPFALRWALKASPAKSFHVTFNNLIQSKYIYAYPTLIEKKRQPVAQSEHTIIIYKGKVEVITI